MTILFLTIDKIRKYLQELKDNRGIVDFRISLKINNNLVLYIISESTEIDLSEFLVNENIDVEFIKLEEIENDTFYKKLFSSGDENVLFKDSRKRFTSLLNTDFPLYTAPCPIVTFYSYKGGLGRSTTLACAASYLAKHKNLKVFIMDCDFEAPGFTNFYLNEPCLQNHNNGLIEYLIDKEFSSNPISINKYTTEVSKDYTSPGEIRIMPAGNLSDTEQIDEWLENSRMHYLEALSRLDLNSSEFIIDKFKSIIDDINSNFKPDIILIDSRTGFTDIFGLSALGLSNLVVGFFGNSIQNNPGLHTFIDLVNQVKRENYTGILVNSFSRRTLFESFCDEVDSYFLKLQYDNELSIDLKKFYFSRNPVLERIGTIEEDKTEFINFIQYKESKELSDLVEYIYDSTQHLFKDLLKENSNLSNSRTSIVNVKTQPQITDTTVIQLKKSILENLQNNWSQLYAEDVVDFNEEYEGKRYFYRKCMLDIFNLNKFLILGNKGTGKTYIYRSLKNENIVNEIKKRANKSDVNFLFFHLVEHKNNIYFDTIHFNNYSIINKELFYHRFWVIYIWNAIMQLAKQNNIDYISSLPFHPITNDTATAKYFYDIINSDTEYIKIEQDLVEFDKFLSIEKNRYLIVVFDDLDVIVKPNIWAERIAPLLNLWKRNPYNKIIPKMFVRRDLFNKISGVTNIKELENQAISIEWSQEELFAYFFKLVFSKSRDDFFEIMKLYNDIDREVISQVKRKSEKDNQPSLEHGHLRALTETFFGKYADLPKYGESYDWIYKNLKNADDTVSLRPFIDLLKLAIDFTLKSDNSEKPILPAYSYTNKSSRVKAIENHFGDLASEEGNKDLKVIFDFIDGNPNYKYFDFNKFQFYELFDDLIKTHGDILENKSTKDLIELLKVNGIIQERNYGTILKYSFAFLYKYRLGLRDRTHRNRFKRKNKY
jgi:cellulose biosynthesis protein BcsQ